MDFQIAESEILAVAGLCNNDFKNEKKDVLLVNVDNAELFKMLLKFGANIYALNANIKRENLAENADKVAFYNLAINLKINKFDLIIDLQNKEAKHYQKLLKNNGILIVDVESLSRDSIVQKHIDCNVLMPFKIAESSTQKYYIFASNKFHPIADFSLQKLDMAEDLRFCNARIYEACFAMPNYIKMALRGVVRN